MTGDVSGVFYSLLGLLMFRYEHIEKIVLRKPQMFGRRGIVNWVLFLEVSATLVKVAKAVVCVRNQSLVEEGLYPWKFLHRPPCWEDPLPHFRIYKLKFINIDLKVQWRSGVLKSS